MSTQYNRHPTSKHARLIGMTSEQCARRATHASRKPSWRPFYFPRTQRGGFVGRQKIARVEAALKRGLRLPSWVTRVLRRAR